MIMRNKVIETIVEHHRDGPSVIRRILGRGKPKTKGRREDRPKYVRGVFNGNFFRVKIPEKRNFFPNLPSFPSILPVPAKMKGLLRDPSKLSLDSILSNMGPDKSLGRKISEWMVVNWPTMLLNVGSVCTLLAFTRSDVLELRTLSATGSISNAIYRMTQKPFLWITVAWPCIFASVNGYKIMEILHERNALVHLDEEQEHIFVEHFMQHGITPKQFERIEKAAKVIKFKKGQALISKGGKLDNVYLIVHGSTQAHIKGRHLTAQSTSPKTKGDQKQGGDSGAWIGEMRFLDRYWEAQQKSSPHKMKTKQAEAAKTKDKVQAGLKDPPFEASTVLYSVLAREDCVVWAWSYDEMACLVSSSTVSIFMLSYCPRHV
jgi:hypothetical protein